MLDTFLVCGLGGLGQNCVIALKKFGVKVVAIEKNKSDHWEVDGLIDLIDLLIIGDCSDKTILQQAQINDCRAALIVTTSEKVNIQTAIAIRQLNSQTRLVVRSQKENLNDLLSKQLGNFIAYEPTHLPANAFALSALGSQIIGLLDIEGEKLRISQISLDHDHPWCYNHKISELSTRNRRIVSHRSHNDTYTEHSSTPFSFYQWESSTKISPKDTIIYVETEDSFRRELQQKHSTEGVTRNQTKLNLKQIKTKVIEYITNFWKLNLQQQIKRVAFFSGLIVIFLILVGTALFKYYYPGTSFFSAFSVTAILLLGGYADLFGSFEPLKESSEWLQLFSLTLTLAGTAFVGVLYAVLTEALLSSKFQLARKHPPIPKENHIVIVGFGRVGQRIAKVLKEFKESVLAITLNLQVDVANLEFPLITGEAQKSLELAHLDKAKSVVIVTDDDILNLELALMIKAININTNLVIRTNGDSLTENLSQLLPTASVIGAYEVAAEAFAGAAFGENILNLCRVKDQTILVTEYHIEAGDNLNQLILAQIAYGYGAVPIYYQSPQTLESIYLPSDDLLLDIGDRLIVLATIEALKNIEKRELKPPEYILEIKSVQSETAAFEGANVISRISGCSLDIARKSVKNLPQILPVRLYQHQGMRLLKTLSKNRVDAELKT